MTIEMSADIHPLAAYNSDISSLHVPCILRRLEDGEAVENECAHLDPGLLVRAADEQAPQPVGAVPKGLRRETENIK